MAGHSKWANIKHRKAGQDAKRGKLFTKIIREISVAVKSGGADPASNPSLRTVIDKALNVNMKRDSIDNNIKKATGTIDSIHYTEVLYEGYAAGGIAILVDCLSDNRHRTAAQVRHAFSKAGGNLGVDGSVAYLFNKVGIISYASDIEENALMQAALESGAEDMMTHDDGSMYVITAWEDYMNVKQAMLVSGYQPTGGEVTMQAAVLHQINRDDAEKIAHLVDILEDLDDVQNVYSNADIPRSHAMRKNV